MASNTACNACLRALRQSARNEIHRPRPSLVRTPPTSIARPLSTSARLLAAQPARKPEDESAMHKFAKTLRNQKATRAATEPYVAYGATQELFKACAVAGEYTMPDTKYGEGKQVTATGEELGVGQGWWYNELGLKPTFNNWAQITFLHMYILTVRLRLFPADHARVWHQNLLDHFFYAAEDRMAALHAVAARTVRNKYLKDLFVQWRGVLAAYDEGLIKGDAVLASAVWRNLFSGSEDVDVVAVAQVVAWLKKGLANVDKLQDTEVAGGKVNFPNPKSEAGVVEKKSALMDAPFETAAAAASDGDQVAR